MGDLLIRGGEVIDGLGAQALRSDLRITDGSISEIGPNLVTRGEREVDASGAYVAPGFIDAHTHCDPWLFWEPSCDPLPAHGVTTVVTGNCSLSLAPLKPEHRAMLMDMFCFIEDLPAAALDSGVPFDWESWSEFRRSFDARGASVAVVPLVGHSALRLHVIGAESIERASTVEERSAIAACFTECLRNGAFGISTSFVDVDRAGNPVPSRAADEAEFDALAEVMREVGHGVVEFVPRFPKPKTHLADVERIHRMCQIAGVPGTWTQLASGGTNADLVPTLLEQAQRTQKEGPGVFPQVSARPFDMAVSFKQTPVFVFIPAWNDWIVANAAGRLRMIDDPEWRARARADWDRVDFSMFPVNELERVRITAVGKPELERWVGSRFSDLVKERGAHPSDVLADWVRENDFDPGMRVDAVANGDPAETAPLILSDATLYGASDAGAHIGMMCGAGDSTLLFERHVKQRNDLRVEAAVKLLTSDVAKLFGVHDRGRLEVGSAGDVCVFALDELHYDDLITVADLPDGSERLSRPPGGFRATVVGGVPTHWLGESTGERPGRMLEPGPRG